MGCFFTPDSTPNRLNDLPLIFSTRAPRPTAGPRSPTKASRAAAAEPQLAPLCGRSLEAAFSPLFTHRSHDRAHPLYREGPTELEIIGVRSDMLVAQLPDNTRRGIPGWMFDEAVCAAVHHSPRPMVEVTSLLEILKLLELNGSALRSARDECTSQAKEVCAVEVAIPSTNASVRKRRMQQTSSGREEVRVRRADSGVDRSGRRSPPESDRRAP